jgi:hypothetical protein
MSAPDFGACPYAWNVLRYGAIELASNGGPVRAGRLTGRPEQSAVSKKFVGISWRASGRPRNTAFAKSATAQYS